MGDWNKIISSNLKCTGLNELYKAFLVKLSNFPGAREFRVAVGQKQRQ